MGNILTASDGAATHSYSYTNDQWQDLLTAFDNQAIAYQGQTYDAETNTVTGTAVSGNPVSYFNGTRWTFGWTNGRQLISATDGTKSISYTYTADGLRMTKTVGGVVHTYLYAGGKLLRETYGETVLDFFYDANGTPFALKHNGSVYYYITNLQGDVLFLVDADGETVAEYTYDPYGKLLTATGTVAEANPLRYRGYYYDAETAFYYLQSRYYDPTTCRFLNADGYASTGQGIVGHNMFAYCGSSPAANTDAGGTMFVGLLGGNPEGFIGAGSGRGYSSPGVDGKSMAFTAGVSGSKGREIEKYIDNKDPSVVASANFLGFYYDVPVIKVPFMNNSAFTFGLIFMGNNGDANLVKHEYGHILQHKELGTLKYFSFVVIPSSTGFTLSMINQNIKDSYYSLPWEYDANQRVGAEADAKDWAPIVSYYYWTYVNSLP